MSAEPDRTRPAGEAGGRSDAERRAGEEWRRRRRLAEVFGDVLPETTRDEREDGAGRGGAPGSENDAWLRAQVPPHHGG